MLLKRLNKAIERGNCRNLQWQLKQFTNAIESIDTGNWSDFYFALIGEWLVLKLINWPHWNALLTPRNDCSLCYWQSLIQLLYIWDHRNAVSTIFKKHNCTILSSEFWGGAVISSEKSHFHNPVSCIPTVDTHNTV